MSPADQIQPANSGGVTPEDAVRALCARLAPVGTETVALAQAAGRVLAEPLVADRDSPPCDVSAMDGYAVRLTDLAQPALAVAGEVAVGQAPPELPAGKALRIFTGAPVPTGTDAVIPREEVREETDRIVLRAPQRPPAAGLYIRRRGENLRGGYEVLPGGCPITPVVAAGLASFGVAQPQVHRRVRVAVINTGSELVSVDARPQPWQIRDSNGPGLAAVLASRAWLDARQPVRVGDEFETLRRILADVLCEGDAVLLTGGVSVGQYDFVPDVVRALGGETVFHRLPIRPGRPILGAVGPRGQAILGLPGNPVSVLVAARRVVWPVLRRLAGCAATVPNAPAVILTNPDERTLHLWWYRLVRLVAAGAVELVPTQGSGDLVSLARSDGFVEVPPHTSGAGPWPFYAWEA